MRHAGGTTERTVRHTLMVSELYTAMAEQARSADAKLVAFAAEAACWWRDGLGNYVKPDAYLVLDGPHGRDHWWVEADLATESLPTIRRKLLNYLSFLERGQLGPGGVVPRVLVITITPALDVTLSAKSLTICQHLPGNCLGPVLKRKQSRTCFRFFANKAVVHSTVSLEKQFWYARRQKGGEIRQ